MNKIIDTILKQRCIEKHKKQISDIYLNKILECKSHIQSNININLLSCVLDWINHVKNLFNTKGKTAKIEMFSSYKFRRVLNL